MNLKVNFELQLRQLLILKVFFSTFVLKLFNVISPKIEIC